LFFVARYVELEAKVTFKSNQPVSFCSIIEFSDDNQLAVCFLTIYATADNNLLTTYIHSIKSSFDETYLKKHISISYPSILLESLKDNDDIEEIPDNHRVVCFYFFFLICHVKYFRIGNDYQYNFIKFKF